PGDITRVEDPYSEEREQD
ncbi:MAG: hypothetical protein J07AB43_03850, partial [Candidatus Nanosalina sp. J07AB43]